jgi:hypothetical protein
MLWGSHSLCHGLTTVYHAISILAYHRRWRRTPPTSATSEIVLTRLAWMANKPTKGQTSLPTATCCCLPRTRVPHEHCFSAYFVAIIAPWGEVTEAGHCEWTLNSSDMIFTSRFFSYRSIPINFIWIFLLMTMNYPTTSPICLMQ